MAYSNLQAAQQFYARQRRRAREEATSGHGGGLREQNDTLGLHVIVALSVAAP